jgi:predicted nucleotidyltransferase component of viral defense system
VDPRARRRKAAAVTSLPRDLVKFLPRGTAETWLTIAPLMPHSAYLVGGTALTVHLLHRESRDLDFFLEQPEDLLALASAFEDVGSVIFDQREERTINCLFNATKVQVLEAASQKILEPTFAIGGIQVASLPDILATKLKVVSERGELRDYFDIMVIEQTARLLVEDGLAWALDKYNPNDRDEFVGRTVHALGYTDDVLDDPSLPVERKVIEAYWTKRATEIRRP